MWYKWWYKWYLVSAETQTFFLPSGAKCNLPCPQCVIAALLLPGDQGRWHYQEGDSSSCLLVLGHRKPPIPELIIQWDYQSCRAELGGQKAESGLTDTVLSGVVLRPLCPFCGHSTTMYRFLFQCMYRTLEDDTHTPRVASDVALYVFTIPFRCSSRLAAERWVLCYDRVNSTFTSFHGTSML